jgi:hypothetical protein
VESAGGAHLLGHVIQCVDLAVLSLGLGLTDLTHDRLIAEDCQGFHDRVVVVGAQDDCCPATLPRDLDALVGANSLIHELGKVRPDLGERKRRHVQNSSVKTGLRRPAATTSAEATAGIPTV